MPLLPTIFCRPETRDGNRSLNNALHNRYFFGIRWLIWNRHANIDLQDKQGYRPIDRCLIRLVTASEEYDELQKTDPLDRLIKTPFEHIQGDDSYALLIISCIDNRLDLRGYAHRFSKACRKQPTISGKQGQRRVPLHGGNPSCEWAVYSL